MQIWCNYCNINLDLKTCPKVNLSKLKANYSISR